MTLNVLVLGAGPAGLIAAHTLLRAGVGVTVWSRGKETPLSVTPTKSELHGCQYLHAPVFDGQQGYGVPVEYRLDGDPDDYRRKVYGNDWQGTVSVDEYGNGVPHLAWNLRQTYDALWEFWQHRITCHDLDSAYMDAFQRKADLDLIVSTVPAPDLCTKSGFLPPEVVHTFHSQVVWAAGQRDGEKDFPFRGNDFTIECNGTKDVGWYRKATVFGHTTVEWPYRRKPPIRQAVLVNKPLQTNCDCWLNDRIPVVRVGRYGAWRKDYLTHHVIDDVNKALGNVQARLF